VRGLGDLGGEPEPRSDLTAETQRAQRTPGQPKTYHKGTKATKGTKTDSNFGFWVSKGWNPCRKTYHKGTKGTKEDNRHGLWGWKPEIPWCSLCPLRVLGGEAAISKDADGLA
jgi:hypothetical protein